MGSFLLEKKPKLKQTNLVHLVHDHSCAIWKTPVEVDERVSKLHRKGRTILLFTKSKKSLTYTR
jgi:predicted deacetylase